MEIWCATPPTKSSPTTCTSIGNQQLQLWDSSNKRASLKSRGSRFAFFTDCGWSGPPANRSAQAGSEDDPVTPQLRDQFSSHCIFAEWEPTRQYLTRSNLISRSP